jgi:alpha 1,2-mannosyltransferase
MFSGRGIVTAGGGAQHASQLLVQLSLLRAWNCTLPVEIWQLPWEASSFSAKVADRFKQLGATVRNVEEVVPEGSLDMAQLKTLLPSPYSIKATMLLFSSFSEVLLLDANVLPLRDPAFLFDSEAFTQKGSLWWSSNTRAQNWDHEMAHSIVGIGTDEAVPEIDSGQLMAHKARSWTPLLLLLFMNFGANANFYQHLSHAEVTLPETNY